jgi:hypothetical protein
VRLTILLGRLRSSRMSLLWSCPGYGRSWGAYPILCQLSEVLQR